MNPAMLIRRVSSEGSIMKLLWLLRLLPVSLPAQKLPNPSLTPGVVGPSIVADLSRKPHMVNGVEHNMCAPDFRTGPFHHTTEATKKAVCREYKVSDCPKHNALEIDHLLDLDDGGLDMIADLWVQPAPDYHVKDKLEVELGGPHGLVCQGKITLHDAQQCLISNWVACAKRISNLSK